MRGPAMMANGDDLIGWFSTSAASTDDPSFYNRIVLGDNNDSFVQHAVDDDGEVTMTSFPPTSVASPSSSAAAAAARPVSTGDCERLTNFVINTLFAGALCVVGLAGNTASFAILGRDPVMLPVARFLLRSLAVVDNVFLVVFLVNFSLRDLFTYTAVDRKYLNREAWMQVRLATYPLIFMAQSAAIWLTVVVAASRCLIVCMPHRAAVYCSLTATRIGVAGVALFSVVYNLPRYFETKVVREPVAIVNGTVTRVAVRFRRTRFGSTESYTYVYLDVLYYLVGFALPLLLLILFNSTLIVGYHQFKRKRAAMRKANPAATTRRRKSAETREQNVTLIMIVVVLLFVVTNVPAKVVQIAWSYGEQPCPSAAYLVGQLSVVFELLGSAINFFVYFALMRGFRRHLSACCPRLWRRLLPASLLVRDDSESTGMTLTVAGGIPMQQQKQQKQGATKPMTGEETGPFLADGVMTTAGGAATKSVEPPPSTPPTPFGGDGGGSGRQSRAGVLDVRGAGTPVTLVDCSRLYGDDEQR